MQRDRNDCGLHLRRMDHQRLRRSVKRSDLHHERAEGRLHRDGCVHVKQLRRHSSSEPNQRGRRELCEPGQSRLDKPLQRDLNDHGLHLRGMDHQRLRRSGEHGDLHH